VVAVLNRLVLEGVLVSYRTNFHGSVPCPAQIEITIVGRLEAGSEAEVLGRVTAELSAFAHRAAIQVRTKAD
jgi:hypothetical protein